MTQRCFLLHHLVLLTCHAQSLVDLGVLVVFHQLVRPGLVDLRHVTHLAVIIHQIGTLSMIIATEPLAHDLLMLGKCHAN